MKVVVTGASGFVGRHVLRALAEHSIHSIAVSRTPELLKDMSTCSEIIEWDVSCVSRDCFEKLGRPDVLIHLAWAGLSNYNSLHHFESELPRQYAFLKAMVEGGLPSMLVAGTCFEYGMQEGCLSEGRQPCPHNPYGFAKDVLRRQLEFLQATSNFELTWARLFYTYGEGQPKRSLYSQFKEAVSRGDGVFNMSSGEQLRDYLPIEGLARLIVSLVVKGNGIGVVNVCSGKPTSVKTLVEGWVKERNSSIELNRSYYPLPDYEPMAFWGCRSKLDAVLGVNS